MFGMCPILQSLILQDFVDSPRYSLSIQRYDKKAAEEESLIELLEGSPQCVEFPGNGMQAFWFPHRHFRR